MPAPPGDKQIPRSEEVFISYSRKDKEFVRRLYEALKRRDREAWVDWEDIRPAEEFMQAIYSAIEGADTFISVLTPDSVASIPCGLETAHAASHNKRMVPIVARDVIADTVPEALRKLNWIFCRDGDHFEEATDKLISVLDTDLDWVHAHTRLLTRAIEWEAKRENESFVLRGDDLRAAEQWLAQAPTKKEPKPTALQTECIAASRKDANQIASRENVSLARYSKEHGKNAQALAELAQALRLNPENREASGLTAAMLTQLSWPVPLTSSMRHDAVVTSARFSPDGQRVVTASRDNTARLWDVVNFPDKDTREDILLLTELAEGTGGATLDPVEQVENLKLLTPEQVRASWDKIAAKFSSPASQLTPLERFMKWSVSDRRSRTISPLSQETVSEWLENRIKEGTAEALRAAMQVDPANARLTAHLGRRLANQALKQGKAGRARGEADFLTSRAIKLAPDNDEVKKLRDEAIKLLGLKTN